LLVSKWYGLEKLADRASKTSMQVEQRDDIVKTLLREYSVTQAPLGFGIGAFEAIYPRLEGQYNRGRYVRAHSDVVEAFVSMGLLTLPIVVFGMWAFVANGVQGALLAAAIFPHVLVDFAASHWLIWMVIILLLPTLGSGFKDRQVDSNADHQMAGPNKVEK
ncbi:MAG: hypothetical protein OXT49_00780, partial [Gammaproteobacteria bacterium]|nr:hypothetical protein [Gammaproteobacteria bacterium]